LPSSQPARVEPVPFCRPRQAIETKPIVPARRARSAPSYQNDREAGRFVRGCASFRMARSRWASPASCCTTRLCIRATQAVELRDRSHGCWPGTGTPRTVPAGARTAGNMSLSDSPIWIRLQPTRAARHRACLLARQRTNSRRFGPPRLRAAHSSSERRLIRNRRRAGSRLPWRNE